MNPLSFIFALGVRVRNSFYDHGILKVRRLRGPVVSVGNLSTGGSGKTPFVMLLGELLKSRGHPFRRPIARIRSDITGRCHCRT